MLLYLTGRTTHPGGEDMTAGIRSRLVVPWRRSQEAGGNQEAGGVNAGAQLTFSYLIILRLQPREWCHPQLARIFLTSVNLI